MSITLPTEPVHRDVYFWCQSHGVMEFRDVLFHPHADQDKMDITTRRDKTQVLTTYSYAKPRLQFVRRDIHQLPPLQSPESGTVGMLWTISWDKTTGRINFHDMMPAMLMEMNVVRQFYDAELGFSENTIEHVEVTWHSMGPFVAEGYTEPRWINAPMRPREPIA